ncbi:MAG: flagellar motor switch protein FliN [Desulfobacterales bacterium]|nr:flagellar motor switch protein FliN [Desulfobacterales bacterium]
MSPSGTLDIKESIASSVRELFDTMLDMAVEPLAMGSRPPMEGHNLVGSLTFAGEVVGSINIQVDEPFARAMTAAMLGMEPEEIESEEEIKDVIREICNIVGGNLKTDFENAGMSCAISTPSITAGQDFEMETLNMDRYEYFGFQFETNTVFVELAVKAADPDAEDIKQKLTAVDLKKFGKLDIIASTGDTVLEFFDVMLSMEVDLSDATDFPEEITGRYMGAINFAGEVTGTLKIQLSEEFAKIMTASMLGMLQTEITEEEIKDVIGEATNIISGNLKAAFNDSGINCRISPPSITAGRQFTMETVNMDRYERYAFRYDKHDIFVEVCIKIDESVITPDRVDAPTLEADDPMQAAAQGLASEVTPAAATGNSAQPESQTTDQDPSTAPPEKTEDDRQNFNLILGIPLELTIELGRARMKIDDLLKLGPGSTVALENLEDEPLDILANDQLVARGKVVVEGEKYGIRITEIVSPRKRLESMQ